MKAARAHSQKLQSCEARRSQRACVSWLMIMLQAAWGRQIHFCQQRETITKNETHVSQDVWPEKKSQRKFSFHSAFWKCFLSLLMVIAKSAFCPWAWIEVSRAGESGELSIPKTPLKMRSDQCFLAWFCHSRSRVLSLLWLTLFSLPDFQ